MRHCQTSELSWEQSGIQNRLIPSPHFLLPLNAERHLMAGMQVTPPPQMSETGQRLLASLAKEREEFKRRSRVVASQFFWASVGGDAFIVITASVLNLTFLLHFRLIKPDFFSRPGSFSALAAYFSFGVLGIMLLLAHNRAYEPSHLLRFRQACFLILKSSFVWSVSVLCVTRVFDFVTPLPRIFSLSAGVCVAAFLLLWRFILHRVAMRDRFSNYLRERIIFIGWNELSERCATFIRNDPNQPYTLVGCMPSSTGEYELSPPDDLPNLAVQRDLVQMIKSQRIDIVILSDRTSTMQERDELATVCEKEMIQFKVIPSYFPVLVSGLSIQTISGIPVLGISHLPLDRPLNQCSKRIVDVVGAAVGLILSAPIIALFGAIVYIENPGSIFFRQRRVGKGGRVFEIKKLRSMRLGSDAQDHLRQSTGANDVRLLRIGPFMRRWNIDELPQYWNVLHGHMSLVGPRPERPYHWELLKEQIPHYNARHSAKPGMTGWAAVNGLRGDTDLRERIRCDLFYLERWSLWLDFQIMILTFFRRQGAV